MMLPERLAPTRAGTWPGTRHVAMNSSWMAVYFGTAHVCMFTQDCSASARPDGELMSEIQNIFMVYDDDNSGSLDEEEFGHALSLCGECAL